ncbi:MAG TPA: acyl-CoA thioesterase II [Rubricoccaceae bacterium]|jgi:acyl-CoA thioesterase-2
MTDSDDALGDLLDLLDLERIELHMFRGRNRPIGSDRVFGGQVLAQALVAAGRTVPEDRHAHSLHAYFILPGDVRAPILYTVESLRDGGSFATRRVTAVQHGRPIFNASLSFARDEPGLDHQSDPAPAAPSPDDVTPERDLARAIAEHIPEPLRTALTRERPIDFRSVDPVNPFAPEARDPNSATWFRAAGALPDDRIIHQAILAYASDWGLLGTTLLPHARSVFDPTIQAASLDHAIWFHRPFRADDWLLYALDSPSAFGARGFARGSVFSPDGALVASTAQEGLIRPVAARVTTGRPAGERP